MGFEAEAAFQVHEIAEVDSGFGRFSIDLYDSYAAVAMRSRRRISVIWPAGSLVKEPHWPSAAAVVISCNFSNGTPSGLSI